MQEKKIRSARIIIKVSVILRLLWNTFLSVWMASSYSDLIDNLIRINYGGTDLPIVIAGLFIDTLLTILWLYKPTFHTIHLVVYILLGWLYYGWMLIDLMVLDGMGAAAALLFIMPFLCLIGIVPFIVCGVGRRMLTNALSESESTNTDP